MKLHQNPSSGSRVVPCGRTDIQTKLIVASLNSANAQETVEIVSGRKNILFFSGLTPVVVVVSVLLLLCLCCCF